jgi:hypothetical protein
MQRVRVAVGRLRKYASDVAFEVFGDLGTGTIDFDHPLTPRPVALWPGAARRVGHLSDGHLALRHLDSVSPDGHLESGHEETEHLLPAIAVTFDTPAYVFGRFQHAVTVSDGAGNASAASTAAVTVNSSPTIPEGVTRSGYDAQTDRVTFSFVASRFTPVSGK